MMKLILLGVLPSTIVLLANLLGVETRRQDGICYPSTYVNSTCPRVNFLCKNGKCIERRFYCNEIDDCGDKSDESPNCYTVDFNFGPCSNGYTRCDQDNEVSKCIPKEWVCDGIVDCPNRGDEYCEKVNGTEYLAMLKGLQWLYRQNKPESATDKWGSSVDKSAVALYFAEAHFTTISNETRKEMAYEVAAQLLSRMYKTKLQDIPSTDLASSVNAFLVSCLDPRKFYGLDIIQELRTRADQQNYTDPYVFLSLCNAGETITGKDKMKLVETFWNPHRTLWTDTQAVAVMALACASKQPGNEGVEETLRELTMELKQHQYRNGSVENLQTTALVMQALLSAQPDEDPDNFDEKKAVEQILQHQKPDGSFGSLMNTYFVLPLLNCRSLVNISSDHCQSVRRDEISGLDNLANLAGPKIRVQYSLWIGNEKDLKRNLALRVPANMSFYGIMELAAEIDSKYRFEYIVKDNKPFVDAVSGLQDNPEKGTFWFLYTVKESQPSPALESPADIIPKDNEHFVLWYRSGSWIA